MTAVNASTWEVVAATPADEQGIYDIFKEVVSHGETYLYLPETTFEQAMQKMVRPPSRCFVIRDKGKVVGYYAIRSNKEGYGDHVGNASYMVHKDYRGQGVASALCRHSLIKAKRAGFDAVQFNFVVSTNTQAVALWQKMGFKIIGTSPKAYRHRTLGKVDVYIMHRFLDDIEV